MSVLCCSSGPSVSRVVHLTPKIVLKSFILTLSCNKTWDIIKSSLCEPMWAGNSVVMSLSICVVCVCFPKKSKIVWKLLKNKYSSVSENVFPQQESTCCAQSVNAWSTCTIHSFIPHENPQALTCFRAFQKFTFSQGLRGMLARTVSWH